MTAQPDCTRPTGIPLRFIDPEMEARYRAAEDGRSVRLLRVASIGGIGLMLLIAGFLEFLVPVSLRGGVSPWQVALIGGLIALAGFASTSLPVVAWHPQRGVAAIVGLYGALIAMLLREMPTEFVANRGFMLMMLHIFSIYSLVGLRLLPAAMSGWMALALYALVLQAGNVIDTVSIGRHIFWLGAGNIWGMWICHQLELGGRREFAARAALDRERARSEKLLLNILPAPIAARLKDSHEPIAEHRNDVTVLFADLVGFTPFSARLTPTELVSVLDDIFTRFDALALEHGLEKIKTIGDAYMAVAGLPQEQPDHGLRAARMAVAMGSVVRDVAARRGEALQVRVGLHSGPVVAGVIGRSKFSYDLWGDTVNTASRMESTGLADTVQCSAATAVLLGEAFKLESRGHIEVKGKGRMETFLVAR